MQFSMTWLKQQLRKPKHQLTKVLSKQAMRRLPPGWVCQRYLTVLKVNIMCMVMSTPVIIHSLNSAAYDH